jgi:transposase
VTQIPGVETIALPLFSKVGRGVSRWPTGRHFASWLALCPDNDISDGHVLWRGMRKVSAVFDDAVPGLPPAQNPPTASGQ